MSGDLQAAIYARVSSEQQAEARTIASQVAALRARVLADGLTLTEELVFIDEGYSGATLVRPALERLRDLAAAGGVDRLYVHSPDRLARKYAYQVLLLDELATAGVEVVFLNRELGRSPEDDLLLQVQGMVAEYERAKILERSRRGKRHGAQTGAVSVLSGAPYGYRYVRKDEGGGAARYEIVLEEARRGPPGLPLGRAGARHDRRGHPSVDRGRRADPHRQDGLGSHHRLGYAAEPGLRRLGGLRQDQGGAAAAAPARAAWPGVAAAPGGLDDRRPGRRLARDPGPAADRPGPVRGRPGATGRESAACAAAAAGCSVPPARTGRLRPVWLRFLRQAGRAGPRHVVEPRQYAYYRCLGTDAYRFGGERVCTNTQVRTDRLEAAVWQEVRRLLEQPQRLEQEYRRRLEAPPPDASVADLAAVQAQRSKVRQGLARLIDSYAEGFIDKEEFEPRIARLRQRLASLEEQARQLADDATLHQDLRLLIGRLEEFAGQVTQHLDAADWDASRDLIRTTRGARRDRPDQDPCRLSRAAGPFCAEP